MDSMIENCPVIEPVVEPVFWVVEPVVWVVDPVVWVVNPMVWVVGSVVLVVDPVVWFAVLIRLHSFNAIVVST